MIDLPPDLDVNPLPNLGPKVNHHFRLNNSAYLEIEHPRWGILQSVTPLLDLKAGDELFTNYGYGQFQFPADFPWYWETKMALERQERIEREGKERVEKEKEKAKKDKSEKKGKTQKKQNKKKNMLKKSKSSKENKNIP